MRYAITPLLSAWRHRMLKLVVLRVAARLLLDWTTWAAIALAVVIGHSGIAHLRADTSLRHYYGEVAASPLMVYIVGAVQLAVALTLLWRRTRSGACAALIALAMLSAGAKMSDGRTAQGLLPELAVLAAAIAVAIGERRRARHADGIDT
jgi:hypothetical protein